MRIKKYQKILCLGLALLSIMVLPCYASNDFKIDMGYMVGNVLFSYERANTELYNIPNEKFISTFSIIPDSSPKIITQYTNINYYTLVYCLIEYDINNSYYINMGKKNNSSADYLLYAIKKEIKYVPELDMECYFLIYRVPFNAFKYSDGSDITNEPAEYYYADVSLYYNDNISGLTIPVFEDSQKLSQISIFTYTGLAVENITTYTNLLIENFGKAFTFITGPGLAWVLLGISVSLISFGVYSAKRFL